MLPLATDPTTKTMRRALHGLALFCVRHRPRAMRWRNPTNGKLLEIVPRDDYLQNKAGKRFNIVPGMIANVDIKTGEKTVMDYLVKPFNKVKEALRER